MSLDKRSPLEFESKKAGGMRALFHRHLQVLFFFSESIYTKHLALNNAFRTGDFWTQVPTLNIELIAIRAGKIQSPWNIY